MAGKCPTACVDSKNSTQFFKKHVLRCLQMIDGENVQPNPPMVISRDKFIMTENDQQHSKSIYPKHSENDTQFHPKSKYRDVDL